MAEDKHWLNDHQDILRALSDGDTKHIYNLSEELEEPYSKSKERVRELSEENILEYSKGTSPSHNRVRLRDDEEHWLNDYRDILRVLQQNDGVVQPQDSLRFKLDGEPYRGLGSKLNVLEKHGYIERTNGRDGKVILAGYGDRDIHENEKNADRFVASYEMKDYGGENVLWMDAEDDVFVSSVNDELPEKGAVRAVRSDSSPIPGMKGADVEEYAESLGDLEDSKA